MALSSPPPRGPSISLVYIILLVIVSSVLADDVTLYDDSAPKSNNCNNPFQLVKVMSWVNDAEGESLVGLSARFGALLPSRIGDDLKLPAVFTNPLNSCSSSSSKLSGSIALSIRGDCDFTIKAEVAQAGGAAALVVINDKEGCIFAAPTKFLGPLDAYETF